MLKKVDLFELYRKGIIKEGGHSINVPIKKANGDKYDGKTYSIPLEYLYYNNQNGRIGVALSEYENAKGTLIPEHSEEYNKIIQKILTDSDQKTKKDMNKLKRDISIKRQEEPGYVLSDGRVIDGNRRFTALRLLEQDDSILEQQYFEAVILDDLSVQNHDDQKKIKSLELQIQFGKLDKVDYNPIDRAMDAFKTVKKNNIMSAKEYAEYAGIKAVDVNKRILEAELIVEFLNFVNVDEDNFSLAKELDLDGPIQEMLPLYRKNKNSENLPQILNTLFSKIIQMRSSNEDFKSEFRQVVKDVIGTDTEQKFIEEMEEATDTIVDVLDRPKPIKNNVELFTILDGDKSTVQALSEVKVISSKYSEKAKNLKEKNIPLTLIEKAHSNIEAINKQHLINLEKKEMDRLKSRLLSLKDYIDEILLEEF
ncbi:RNA polymerase subunit sigma-70 [Vagococcus sp. PNs007]|uniref:RNA polymerase subunit sigma-70 n=1 Tax=Vagococcus proximus TaxID=2991417 RepID=A0ABT5X2F8_9ENTE|nr:RNA polymerase subunit sigma-70 [Vagococcus proximus]MDF0480163.1 RNA polymerase subunit sigma-70 [Vagococcus proximus]